MDDLQDQDRLRRDFDRLAEPSDDGWDHNAQYHAFLLRQLPSRCREGLGVGCGSGAFARLLTGRSDRYLTLAEVRRACAGVLPGAAVRRHLLWRYSIVWRKPWRTLGTPPTLEVRP